MKHREVRIHAEFKGEVSPENRRWLVRRVAGHPPRGREHGGGLVPHPPHRLPRREGRGNREVVPLIHHTCRIGACL